MNKPDWSEPFDLNYVKDDENEAIEEDLSVPSIDMFAVGINEQLERRRLADEEDDDEGIEGSSFERRVCHATSSHRCILLIFQTSVNFHAACSYKKDYMLR